MQMLPWKEMRQQRQEPCKVSCRCCRIVNLKKVQGHDLFQKWLFGFNRDIATRFKQVVGYKVTFVFFPVYFYTG